ncbi:spindle-pole body protein, variant [Blastomyces gilchristii SLH14081]|uniref:Spindle-pole body protein n=1 Tax=Blastomyces gilchristii (strain SLH14081) TaxID=559298 RepID=A0A179U8Z2_BLAGS|nr:spindle-pole body protein, variant [Blastomyces gilchristii SLH14081]XP_031575819.1 spindle-pole body protein [Blastomyces gilchristii SLH14081]OAT03797.1 spindle-pole body protein [Blastomyces gilchristii SLH14081]OAT03798.1 spindle-pole body protein, variant [Blastomyces gilchristii SLH14081]
MTSPILQTPGPMFCRLKIRSGSALRPIRLDVNIAASKNPNPSFRIVTAYFISHQGSGGYAFPFNDFPYNEYTTSPARFRLTVIYRAKMALPYIDTPRTEIDGNATYLTNGFRSVARNNLSALGSVENSFQSPSKDHDLIKGFETGRSRKRSEFSLKTPRAGSRLNPTRNALHDRRNLPTIPPPKGEFTPMLNSVSRNNFIRHNNSTRRRSGPETPAALRNGYHSNRNTPGLPNMDMTGYGDDSTNLDGDPTPVPRIASSSAQSTPLPTLPGRNGNVVGDGHNMMTLKEQENVINKLDKENFGLKLKIHFLEQNFKLSKPEFAQAAIQENTELKVTKLTMERDLHQCKKSLRRAEQDLAGCQVELQELQAQANRRHVNENVQRELDQMREDLESKENELHELQEELESMKENESESLQQLREEIQDLQYDLRQKNELVENQKEEIENLKEKQQDEKSSVAELEAELQRAKEQLEDLQKSLEEARSEAREAKSKCEEAIEEKEQAVKDLKELQDEMTDKSFYTKGLSRQLEEKAHKLEDELNKLRKEHNVLEENFQSKTREVAMLEDEIEGLKEDLSAEKARMQDDIDLAQHERDIARRERDDISERLHHADDDIRNGENAKDVLKTRHDALTNESASLQRDLAQAKTRISNLEEQIEAERDQYMNDTDKLRLQHRNQLDQLHDEIESLKHDIEDREGQHATDRDRWDSLKRSLELQKEKVEQQAAGYKRTIDKLQNVETTLSSREDKLQNIIESEKQRHLQDEELLNRQIKELNDDIASKRQAAESQRQELLSVKEELRAARREESSLREKLQALEDDIVVLQATLEEERAFAGNQQKSGASDLEKQLQAANKERQVARDNLANANIEIHNLRMASAELEAERDELQSQIRRIQGQVDDTYRLDQEKIDLRKSKLRLENELSRLRDEKRTLLETKDKLQADLDNEIVRAAAEENRLSGEIDQLQDKIFMSSERRDRELVAARSKAERLELRTRELETLLNNQASPRVEASLSPDFSILRRSLEDARRQERDALQRESTLKASIRDLKTRIVELDRENHELKAKELTTRSSNGSPTTLEVQGELRSLRSQLLDMHKSMKDLKSQNHELQHATVNEEERKDLHELLKSSTLEAESLAVRLSERDARVNELRIHLRRVRDERAISMKKADAAHRELESLQDRYDALLDELTQHSERKGRHAREINGLGKEIMWLRARLAREEKFRRDLAWSKGLMELGERVRIACNETDLKMIAEMGVKPPSPRKKFNPRLKLKAVACTILAVCRMQMMSAEWSKSKKLGEGLRRAKGEVLKKRESMRRKAVPAESI